MTGFFKALGKFVSRAWMFLLAAWIAAAFILPIFAPPWDDMCQDGEFSFLPQDVPSLAAEKLFAESFPDDLLGSSIIIVVHRPTQKDGLLEKDKEFIEYVLKPRIEEIAEEMGGLADIDEDDIDAEVEESADEAAVDAPPAAEEPPAETVVPPAPAPVDGSDGSDADNDSVDVSPTAELVDEFSTIVPTTMPRSNCSRRPRRRLSRASARTTIAPSGIYSKATTAKPRSCSSSSPPNFSKKAIITRSRRSKT